MDRDKGHPFDGYANLPIDIWDEAECGDKRGWWLVPAVVIGLAGLAALVWWGW